MSSSALHPNTLVLMRRMTAPQPSHERFVGEAVDMTAVDEQALGDLWTLANKTETHRNHGEIRSLAADTARMILALGQNRQPIFRGPACSEYLDHVADEAEAVPEAERGRFDLSWPLQHACFALNRCIDLSFKGLGPPAERLLAATPWRVAPHVAMALARLVGADCEKRVFDRLSAELAVSPLFVEELHVGAELDLVAHLTVADIVDQRFVGRDHDKLEATRRLSRSQRYAQFAHDGLMDAAGRVRCIHEGARPYAADKAFTLAESAVIARLARVALCRDEPWIPPVLNELFLKVTVAPTAAKTVPSQSVGIALGHAIEAFPTPEAVSTLRHALRDIRHAGVAKKLQRNVRGAEIGLATRPQVALRLASQQAMGRAELGTLTRCLEGYFTTSVAWSYGDWQAFALHPQAGALVRSLLWTISDSSGACSTILPVLDRDQLVLRDLTDAPVQPAIEADVTLWHPSKSSADERGAWRDRLSNLRIRQPFKQVFREHYAVSSADLATGEITAFSDHEVSIRPFLGLARREGWRLEYECLARTIGHWTAMIDLSHNVFPGAVGWVKIRRILVNVAGGPARLSTKLDDVPAVVLSEILRSVDLLVSASSFAQSAADDEDPDDTGRHQRLRRLSQLPLGQMSEMRREALSRALSGRDGMDDLVFDARHLRLGRFAIHLATGRVTHDGDPVSISLSARPKLGAVPWLPYDERLLEVIALTALHVASRPLD